MENQKQLDGIYEMVSFIKNNAVTKTEFNERLKETHEMVSFIKDNAVTKTEFNELKGRVGRIESNMVTKDYLDKKMADLRGDLVSLVRKEDNKVGAVVNLLNKKKVFEDEETDEIKRMEPFPIV